MQKRTHRSILLGLVIAAVLGSQADAQALPSAFDSCTADEPGAEIEAVSQCTYEIARRQEASWSEAEGRLERLQGDFPQSPWPPFYLGNVRWFIKGKGHTESYRRSIALSDQLGLVSAGVEARAALIRALCQDEQIEEAERLFEEARQLAEDGGSQQALHWMKITEASLEVYRGGDLEHAFLLLEAIERDVFTSGTAALKRSWLNTVVRVTYPLERNDDFEDALKLQLALAREERDLPSEAWALYALGVFHLTTRLPSKKAQDDAQALFEEALAAARSAKHDAIESLARLELGKLSGGETGGEHLRVCRNLGDSVTRIDCCWALASNLLEQDRDSAEARRLIDEALAGTAELSDPWSIYGWEARLQVHWATLERPEAIQRSLDVLESVETLRDAQTSGPGRTGLLSRWIGPYYWLSGRLLDDSADSTDRRADLELAFTVTERMRARVLLEALEAARASTPPPESEPLMAKLEEILDHKVGIQRRWIDPRLGADERAELRQLLDEVERDEEAARQQLALAYPASAVSRPRDFASLEEIESNLGEEEALLSFQLGLDEDFYGRFAGGSWLLAITRSRTRSYRLPGLVDLDTRLDTALGFTDPDDGLNGYVSLYGDLLAAAIDDLPASVDKLTIIADGQLHRLPFSFLRESKEAEPLVSRFQLSTVPSAKLWLRWRNAQPVPFQTPALVFADPDLPAELESDEATQARNQDLDAGSTLGRLLYARREGRAIVRTLGSGSRLLEGPDATEDAAKSEVDLRRFGILHFAAHALIDEQHPERSAVYLARGAQGDGLLQPWEIVELDLDRRVIVLASCRTAIGEVVRGEGPMSLARAFFRAEAPVVVAGLWQLPDAGTSELFKSFYQRLARGASIADALATAQREMIRGGATGREWAGLVVLGNGAMVPFPGGLPRPIPYRLIAAIAAVLVPAALLLRRRRRSSHGLITSRTL